jgi:hypothetical protein
MTQHASNERERRLKRIVSKDQNPERVGKGESSAKKGKSGSQQSHTKIGKSSSNPPTGNNTPSMGIGESPLFTKLRLGKFLE